MANFGLSLGLAALILAMPVQGAKHQPVALPCATRAQPFYAMTVRPVHCREEPRGFTGLNLGRLRWRGWGTSHAHATGVEPSYFGRRKILRADVVASDVVDICGREAYNQLRVTTADGKKTASGLRPETRR